MADMTPQEKAEDLATNVEARFGSLGTFYSWLDVAVLAMQRTQLENGIAKLQDQQQDSRQKIESSIQEKQFNFDAEIKVLRQGQQDDLDSWQAKINEMQKQLDLLNSQLKGLVSE
jgi:outer membrane protein OmpA-like peptidoglycan-associated protein